MRIGALPISSATALAVFIREGDHGLHVRIPCWGVIARRIAEGLTDDRDRCALWLALVEEGTPHAMVLFIDEYQTNATVMRAVFDSAPRIPSFLQRALVSLPACAALAAEYAPRLHPAASQLLGAEAKTLERERRSFQARVTMLRAFQYFAPE